MEKFNDDFSWWFSCQMELFKDHKGKDTDLVRVFFIFF